MAEVCNFCGAHPDARTEVKKCSYCPTLVCSRCALNHELFCAELQKRKKRGEGPTVVRHIYIPTAAPIEPIAPIDAALAAVQGLIDESK